MGPGWRRAGRTGPTLTIRTVLLAGVVWFVAADVCRALGLAAEWNTMRHLADDERRALDKGTCPDHALFPGRTSRIALISESGLYKLVLRSDKPQARKFQDWVTRVVLPVPTRPQRPHPRPS